MRDLLLVAVGGALGSVLRFLVSGAVQRAFAPASAVAASFPAGTLAVNVTGSLLIGVIAGLAEARALVGPEARLLLVTGVLGGYTTFSAFSLETLLLARAGAAGLAFLTVASQVLLGVAAAWAGFALALALTRPA
ncbi:MAG: fluoride efflux transporter CrcB [Gammaproteobacteria bacterium]|nr:fluoride efflux transporter CrcB [Gammaproteobacteria bacterium]